MGESLSTVVVTLAMFSPSTAGCSGDGGCFDDGDGRGSATGGVSRGDGSVVFSGIA